MNLFSGLIGEQARAAPTNNADPCVWCPRCRGMGGGERDYIVGENIHDTCWEDCSMCKGEGMVGVGDPQWWMQ